MMMTTWRRADPLAKRNRRRSFGDAIQADLVQIQRFQAINSWPGKSAALIAMVAPLRRGIHALAKAQGPHVDPYFANV
jgi:hypothetical protein